jgi:hypothetical protein
MSLSITNFTIQPDKLESKKSTTVTITFKGILDETSSNPVTMNCSLEDESGIYFIDEHEEEVKCIDWSEDFSSHVKEYQKDLTIVAKKSEHQYTEEKLTLKANTDVFDDSCVGSIKYK